MFVRLRRRAVGWVADRLWPYFEERARTAALGPTVHPGAPLRLVRRQDPSYVNLRVVETAAGEGHPITVGRYCSLNEHAYAFLGGNHAVHHVSTFHFHRVMGLGQPLEEPLNDGPIVIGNDVWVAFEAVILSGVTLGDGAVVAARAVVTSDVAPYEIVGGVPARHIGWRFGKDTRDALMRIRWWEWPPDLVMARLDHIQSDDVAAFVRRYDPSEPNVG